MIEMNVLDYVLIGVVSFHAFIGFAAGTLSQFLGILVILFSIAAGYLFYDKTGDLLLLPLVLLGAAVVAKISIYILKKLFLGIKSGKRGVSFGSRIIGALIGVTKGAFFTIILILCLHSFSGFLKKINPAVEIYLANSYLCGKLREGVEFLGIDLVNKIDFAQKILNEDIEGKKIENEEILVELKENTSFKAVLEDEELLKKIRNEQYREVLTDPKFTKLLKDKEFIKKIYNIDYEAIYNRLIDQRK